MPAVTKPRPYRRYLTSALHSRFVHAALLAILSGFFTAFWTGKDWFWSWFPLGLAGLKACLFSMSSLFVFILQLATLTIGRRTSSSPLVYARRAIVDLHSYQTIFWYIISAWWFCEVWVWSVPDYWQLGWILRGDAATPDRLNERPIYLRFFFTMLALVQSGIHIFYSHSSLHILISKPPTPQSNDQRTHPIDSVSFQLRKRIPYMIKNAIVASSVATVFAPFVYKAFFRDLFWQIHLSFAKPFFDLHRSDANPPDTYFIGTILGSAFLVGGLLGLTWEISTYSFLAYITQEPVRNGLPLSAASKDPNGTLLTGLTSKRDVVKTFAFWELTIIAQKHPDRRKAIFSDFERPTGPVWTSIYQASLNIISSIDDRIFALSAAPSQPVQSQQQITTLPRLVGQPRQEPVFATMPPPSTKAQKIESILAAGTRVKALGQSKEPWHPPIDRTKQQLIEFATSPLKQNKGMMDQWTENIASSPLGGFIYARPSSTVTSVVLGAPVGNAAIIVDAIESLTKMLIASLNEDDYGKVVQTVPGTVNQFTRTVSLVESYVKSQEGSLSQNDEKELQEVILIVERLRAGLRELLGAFQVFLNDVGLAIKDLNAARQASEDRKLLPRRQPREQPKTKEVESGSQRKQLGSGSEQQSSTEKSNNRRAEERPPRRLEAGQERRQSDDGNVFGARDLNAQSGRRREMEQVR